MATYPTHRPELRIVRTCTYCFRSYDVPFFAPFCSSMCRDIEAGFERLRDRTRKDNAAQDDADQKPIDPQTTSDQE